MLRSKGFWGFMMAVSLAGWAFILAGLLKPIGNAALRKVWNSVLKGWVLGHPLELLPALFIARRAGVPAVRAVAKTLVFGFTWWVPLFLKVLKK